MFLRCGFLGAVQFQRQDAFKDSLETALCTRPWNSDGAHTQPVILVLVLPEVPILAALPNCMQREIRSGSSPEMQSLITDCRANRGGTPLRHMTAYLLFHPSDDQHVRRGKSLTPASACAPKHFDGVAAIHGECKGIIVGHGY